MSALWSKILTYFPTLLNGNSGATPAIDWNQGSVQKITLNAATVTPTFKAPIAGCNLALVITQDGTGGRAVTWPAAVSWIGGTAPILLSGAGQTTLVYFYWDGTTYWGSLQSGASPQSIIPWTAVAAGTALAASLSNPNLACDTSGTQSNVTLPSAASMTNSDGFEFTIKNTGNMLSPVIVTAGAGTTVGLLNVPGTFGASTWMPIQGQGVTFKYDLSTTTWKVKYTSEGNGAPGTSAYNPQWYAKTDVYWDPVAGVDTDTGAIGHPIKNMAEVVRRYGSNSPLLVYAQNLQIHQLTAQTLGIDTFVFEPKITGGGNYSIVATTPNRGAAFSPTTVTAKVQTSAGNALRLNGNLPAGLAVGDIIKNVTKNSYAKVQAIAGGNATVTQPLSSAQVTTITGLPTFTEDNTWVNTDSYQAMQTLLCNLETTRPVGGDATNPGGLLNTYWYQGIYVPDQSGTPGDSIVTIHPFGCSALFSLCTFDAEMQLNGMDGYTTGAMACTFNTFASLAGGAANGSNPICAACSVTTFTSNGTSCVVAQDSIVSTQLNVFGASHVLGNVLFLSTAVLFIQGSNAQIEGALGAADVGLVYGPGLVNVRAGGTLINATGGTWVNCLKLATIQLDGVATGWNPPSEGTFTLNGVTQVDVAGVNGTNAFPANSTISWSLKTVGGTPGTQSPYFSAATAANAFHVKSPTAGANDIYQWVAQPASSIAITSAAIDNFRGMFNPATGARYANP